MVQLIPSEDVITPPSIATATKRDNSGLHVTLCHWFVATARVVHVIPFGDVITRFPVPLKATATKSDNSLAHVTLNQLLSSALAWVVQLIPSADVITRLPVPLEDTATKSDNSGLHAIAFHELFAALVRIVQFTPSDDVITEPPFDTATKMDNSGLHVTLYHVAVALARVVHVIPSDDVITRVVPVRATATKTDSSGLQTTLVHSLSAADARVCHLDTALLAAARLVLRRSDIDSKLMVFVVTELAVTELAMTAVAMTELAETVPENLPVPTTSNDTLGLVVAIPTLPAELVSVVPDWIHCIGINGCPLRYKAVPDSVKLMLPVVTSPVTRLTPDTSSVCVASVR